MDSLNYIGSTSNFFLIKPGIILKAPVIILQDQTIKERPSVAEQYSTERQILERLGEHPRIVRYHGWRSEFPTGLLLSEASGGTLQHHLNMSNISITMKEKWFRQVIESVHYIHSRGVIHCDIRPDNFLVHGIAADIWLCDFGASVCKELDLDGGGLPDSGFLDPRTIGHAPTTAVDIFSLGSVLYAITTGHWPYRDAGGFFDSEEDKIRYESLVDENFKIGSFPDTQGLFGGHIIIGCWTKKYVEVDEIMQDVANM